MSFNGRYSTACLPRGPHASLNTHLPISQARGHLPTKPALTTGGHDTSFSYGRTLRP